MSARTAAACRIAALALLALAVACTGPQNMLDARGPGARQVATLWWILIAMAAFVTLAIPALLLYAIRQARRRTAGARSREVNAPRLVWIGGIAVPLVMLVTALVYSHVLSDDVYPPRDARPDALTIEITGHSFWWEVRYPDSDVTTANEFHIPVGRDVRLLVTGADVIHSFWVPQLQGKIDMIPGRTHTWWLRADSAGRFRGQCAEYCGTGHALMALWITAVPPAEFEQWLRMRAAPPAAGLDELALIGRALFDELECAYCHVPGIAPDLRHLRERSTLAAGRMANTPANLAAWIRDPTALKPGARMPATELDDAAMEALITYLYSLR